MKNKKKTTIDTDDITSDFQKERRKILKSIEEACQKGDRVRCYELLMEYSYFETPPIPFDKFDKANYHILTAGQGSTVNLISKDFTYKDIVLEVNILTDLYGMGYYLLDGEFITLAVNSKKEALEIAEKTLEIKKKNYQKYNYDISDEQIAHEIYIFGNGKHRPEWLDENGDNKSLVEWRKHPEECPKRLKKDQCNQKKSVPWWLRC